MVIFCWYKFSLFFKTCLNILLNGGYKTKTSHQGRKRQALKTYILETVVVAKWLVQCSSNLETLSLNRLGAGAFPLL